MRRPRRRAALYVERFFPCSLSISLTPDFLQSGVSLKRFIIDADNLYFVDGPIEVAAMAETPTPDVRFCPALPFHSFVVEDSLTDRCCHHCRIDGTPRGSDCLGRGASCPSHRSPSSSTLTPPLQSSSPSWVFALPAGESFTKVYAQVPGSFSLSRPKPTKLTLLHPSQGSSLALAGPTHPPSTLLAVVSSSSTLTVLNAATGQLVFQAPEVDEAALTWDTGLSGWKLVTTRVIGGETKLRLYKIRPRRCVCLPFLHSVALARVE